ncbi:hypothetical protein F4782DRAFT_338738 [Xylaria castorea]|nr:hypothetical protein F4782DRAFT_338738 [Xylaria castorea]
MADPLSIAGLVTGVISLGLQVVGGLSDYLDAVKGRAEELSSAKRQTTNMKDLLLVIEDLLPQVKNTRPTSATSLERHIQSCNTEISALYVLVSKLSQPASSSSGIRLKLAEQKQKLTYPFKRSHLGHLEERLIKVNSALQTALQVTELDVSITTRHKLRQVHDYALTTSHQVQQIHDVSVTTRDELRQGRDVSITTGNQVQQIHDIHVTTRDELRQICDELRAVCQSTTVRAQSTAAGLRSITSESPERVAKGRVGVSLDSFETAAFLASKPSLLSTTIETVTKCDTLLSPRENGSLACLCRPSRRISHYRKNWESFSFSYGTLNTRRHLPSCPLSRIDGEKRTTTVAIEYSGLKRLLQTSFVLSFADTHGAGGRSISPSFAYYPTVDEKTAPAFRIMRSAMYMLVYMVRNGSENEIGDFAKVLQHCFDNVLILYSRGKASPMDLNSYGESIIHRAVNIIDPVSQSIQNYPINVNAPTNQWPGHREDSPLNNGLVADTVFSGIANLITCGVSVATYNRQGNTACGYLLRASHRAIYTKFAKLLVPHASEIPLMKRTDFVRPRFYGLGSITILNQDLKLAEAAECGSLSLAALAGNERLVQEIIDRHPESFEEVNNFGHTPLHLAVNHPKCLRLIIEAGGSSILETADVEGMTPLECACVSGCSESARLLMASGSRISQKCIQIVDSSCQNDLLITMKQRRDELKRLALDNLTKTEAKSLRLHENTVLDRNVREVQKLLTSRGVKIPSHLDKELEYSVYRLSKFPGNSVNHLDQLWALGFRDIDSFDGWGSLPVLEQHNFDAVRWLIEHGTDYWTPLNERRDSTWIHGPATPAHTVFAKMGRQVRIELEPLQFLQTHQWLVGKLLRVRVGDACSCPCSVGGCTPLKAFLGCRKSKFYPRRSHIRTSEDRAWVCVNFIKVFQTCLSKDDLVLFIRGLTFDALELTHTCCPQSVPLTEHMRGRHTSEEIDEVHSEQSTLLALFADLLSHFEEVAFEDRGGTPLITTDPEEFWTRRWLPVISETLDNLNGDDLTHEEKSAAEAIGVVWGPHPVRTTACEVSPRNYSPEYVMKELEKIMNE